MMNKNPHFSTYFIAIVTALLFMYCPSEMLGQKTKQEQKRQFYSALDYIYEGKFEKALPILHKLDSVELENFLDRKREKKSTRDTIQLEKIYVKYLIGACYLQQKYTNADPVPYVEYVIKSGYSQTPDIVFKDLGTIYHQNYKFDNAIFYFNSFLNNTSENDEFYGYAKHMITVCENAKKLLQDTIDYKINKLSTNINTKSSEISPLLSYDKKKLYFIRLTFTEQQNKEPKVKKELFCSNYEFGIWMKPHKISFAPENKKDDFHLAGISHKGHLFFSIGNNITNNLFEYKIEDSTAILERELDFLNSKYDESDIWFSKDENTAFFASNRQGGFGGYDIYKVIKNKAGKWKKPVNLGNEINTPYHEVKPYYVEHLRVLYFASEGHNSMGGFDIFKSRLNNNGNWVGAKNMGFPLNTTRDNHYFTISIGGKLTYISYSQKDRFENHDIYHANLETEIAITVIRGRVVDSKSKKNIAAKIKVLDEDAKNNYLVSLSPPRDTGKYYLFFPPGKKYKMLVEAKGFLPQLVTLDIPRQQYFYPIFQEIDLEAIEYDSVSIGEKVTVKNKFYDIYKDTPESEYMNEMSKRLDDYDQLLTVIDDIVQNKEFVTRDQNYSVSKEPQAKKDYSELLSFVENAIETTDSLALNHLKQEFSEDEIVKQTFFYSQNADNKDYLNKIFIEGKPVYTAPPLTTQKSSRTGEEELEHIYSYKDELDLINENNNDSTSQIKDLNAIKNKLTVKGHIEPRLVLTETLYFETNKADLDSVSLRQLVEIQKLLLKNQKIAIEIEGYSSTPGTKEKNLKLSQQRAESVKSIFIELGINKKRIKTLFFGESDFSEEQEEEERRQNRRVDIKIFSCE